MQLQLQQQQCSCLTMSLVTSNSTITANVSLAPSPCQLSHLEELARQAHIPSVKDTIVLVMKILFMLVGTTCNASVFLVVYRDPQLRLEDNLIHLNLAAFDLLMSAVIKPLSIVSSFTAVPIRCFLRKFAYLIYSGNLICIAEIAVLRCRRILYPSHKIPSR